MNKMLDIQWHDLQGAEIVQFLQEHLDDMYANSPPESVHALDLTGLQKPEIRFWVGRWQGGIVASAALKQLSADHAELKSMRTRAAFRGQGFGEQMLVHAMDQARAMGIKRLSLETGSMAFFKPAQRLYQRHGFEVCGPFADYRLDPHSVFMTKEL